MVCRVHRVAWWLVLAALIVGSLLCAPRSGSSEPIPMGVDLRTRGFELIAVKQGVSVYKHKASPIIRLAADGIFDATVAGVFATLLDYGRQVGTIDRLSEAKVLARGSHYMIVYQRLNLPIISDRDFSVRVWWSRDAAQTTIRYVALRGKDRGGRKGAVHVTLHEGSWQLRPTANGHKTRARFEVTIDMGGWLPRWLAKSGSGKEVPQLFAAINTLVTQRRTTAWPGSSSF